jgi:hypothetical protein
MRLLMRTKLIELQQQLALPLDADLIAKLGWDENSILELTMESGKLIVSAVTDEDRKRKFREALAWVNEQHGATLRRLAE